MSPFTTTGVRIEELGANAIVNYLRQVPALAGIFDPIQGDGAVKTVPSLSTHCSSGGELTPNTGVHRLQFKVELDTNPEDISADGANALWAAVEGAIYQKNLNVLLSQLPGFFCYGIIRKPQVIDYGGNKFHKMISFMGWCIELPPS